MKDRNTKPNRFRGWMTSLLASVRGRVHRDVEAATEPIDFSAPSIPYYAGLANRFALARMLLYLVLVLFLVVTILFNTELITYRNLYYLAKDINAAALTAETPSDYIGYPVSTVEPSFAVYRNGLVVTGGEEITALSASGKQTLTDNVSYATPVVRSSDAYFLTFGRGEPSFRVYNAFVRVYAEETDYPVYDACMADSGDFAVVTRSREYKSEVTVYNRDMQKVTSYRTNRYVTGAALTADGDRLATVSVGNENGVTYSCLQVLRPGKTESEAEIRMDHVTLYRCDFLSVDRVLVVGDTGAWIYTASGKPVSQLALTENDARPVLVAVNESKGQVAFLLQSPHNFLENNLKVFDKSGKTVHTIPVRLDTEALEMSCSEQAVYLRTADTVVRVTVRNGAVEYLSVPANTYAVQILKDEGVLVCTPSHAYRPSAEDWKADP